MRVASAKNRCSDLRKAARGSIAEVTKKHKSRNRRPTWRMRVRVAEPTDIKLRHAPETENANSNAWRLPRVGHRDAQDDQSPKAGSSQSDQDNALVSGQILGRTLRRCYVLVHLLALRATLPAGGVASGCNHEPPSSNS
jgi:hypothetical protein